MVHLSGDLRQSHHSTLFSLRAVSDRVVCTTILLLFKNIFHEQRMYVIFHFKLGKTFSETLEMLKQAFGNESMGRTQTYVWCKPFKDGRTSIEDASRSGRASTSPI